MKQRVKPRSKPEQSSFGSDCPMAQILPVSDMGFICSKWTVSWPQLPTPMMRSRWTVRLFWRLHIFFNQPEWLAAGWQVEMTNSAIRPRPQFWGCGLKRTQALLSKFRDPMKTRTIHRNSPCIHFSENHASLPPYCHWCVCSETLPHFKVYSYN